MLGVIVWSNEIREKAVIWCEDHASLAYLEGRDNLLGTGLWPGTGDLVELESEIINNLRHARQVSLVSERGCMQLPAMLKSSVMAAAPEPHLRLVAVGKPDTKDGQEKQTAPNLRISAAR
ncbi:hypothetical protein H4P12_11225 [Paracoccus sp. 11-3]|uniref:Uncharacterized protein n=1 Tax=Paracoccus amoyensis TaxID=2760093 RepID=A0A926JDQ8_9RHOB|nr:hypothetical protein [Paracoccus amoyensis]